MSSISLVISEKDNKLKSHFQSQCYDPTVELIGSQLVYFAKNNFNRTNVVDDVNGDIQIANLFKDKCERLFNSVQCSKEESELMKTQIDSEVVNVCNTSYN